MLYTLYLLVHVQLNDHGLFLGTPRFRVVDEAAAQPLRERHHQLRVVSLLPRDGVQQQQGGSVGRRLAFALGNPCRHLDIG